jgi:hypothetical protein
LQIDLSQPFRAAVRRFPKARRREIARAIDAARDGFGSSHLHPASVFADCAEIILNVV